MKTLKKIGLLISLSMIFLVACNSEEKAYKNGDLQVDIKKQIVYEKDGKTKASGTYNNKNNKDEIKIVLKDGLVISSNAKRLTNSINLTFKNKILISLITGESSQTKFFNDGMPKEIYNVDAQSKASIKYKEGSENPYYLLVEAKPSNSKILFENEVMVISKLDSKVVIQTLNKTDAKAQMILQQMNNTLRIIAKSAQERMYEEVLKEIL